jgi:hypothetical protein
MRLLWIRVLFAIAGAYDLAIGLSFLIGGVFIFDRYDVPHPNHWGYIQFASLLLMTFGAMFVQIANAPEPNRNLIPFGVLLKLSYIGVVGYWWFESGVPMMFKPFVVIDAVMLLLFLAAYAQLARRK